MKLVALLIPMIFLGCKQTIEESNYPEPLIDSTLNYIETEKTDSISLVKNDSIYIYESINEEDEIVNEYLVKELKPIRDNFKRINSIQKWDSIPELELWESTEGGQANYYYLNGKLEKIIVRHFGEMGQYIGEFYLKNNKISFVFEKAYNYNRPFYWDSIKMKEFNDNQVYDMEKSEIIEDRSYFIGEQLIHQVNNLDCGSPFSDEYLKKEELRIKKVFEDLLKKIKKELN